jgi:phosphatidylglycerophosphatase A
MTTEKKLGSEVIRERLPRDMAERTKLFLATSAGLGYSPFFPGALGALPAIPIYLAIAAWVPGEPQQAMAIGLVTLLVSGLTVWLGTWAEEYFGKKDSGTFVTDEIAGLLLTLLIFHVPDQPWLTLAWAFPVTRIIDMIKVPPAKQLERLPHGWGVVADDLMGSVYAGALLQLVWWLRPGWFGG